MAFENLIIRNSRKLRLYKPLSEEQESWLAVDGVIAEDTTRAMRLTSYPLENGEQVSDHLIKEPLVYVMDGVFTDTPLGATGFATTFNGVVDGVSGIFGKSESTGQTRSQQAYFELVKLQESRALLQIQTSLKLYSDLVLEELTTRQTKDSSRAIFFTAKFKQALLVTEAGLSINADNIADPATSAGVANEINGGSLSTTEATSADEAVMSNTLGM